MDRVHPGIRKEAAQGGSSTLLEVTLRAALYGLEMISGLTVWKRMVQIREYIMESLILAQNERWRRVLSMQVGR